MAIIIHIEVEPIKDEEEVSQDELEIVAKLFTESVSGDIAILTTRTGIQIVGVDQRNMKLPENVSSVNIKEILQIPDDDVDVVICVKRGKKNFNVV